MKKVLPCFITVLFFACSTNNSKLIHSFTVSCEMVANHAKPAALSDPMNSSQVDIYWNTLTEKARSFDVKLYRESEFPVTPLFPRELTEGKVVVLIYKGFRLQQYELLKEDIQVSDTSDREQQLELARRMGRLLGYDSEGINKLLGQNANYSTLADFQPKAQYTDFYYKDPDSASLFYEKILGLRQIDTGVFQVAEGAYLRINEVNGKHPSTQEKSVALALLTNHPGDWYEYFQNNNLPVKYGYNPQADGPHEGFVAVDPEGYLLEFEQFKQHPENELLIPILSRKETVSTSIDGLGFHGSITWTYHNDLLLMQKFYEETLGYQLVADQDWTKIYHTAEGAFIGLVDACRGMENFTEIKAVEICWSLKRKSEFETYASIYLQKYQVSSGSWTGPEGYFYRILE